MTAAERLARALNDEIDGRLAPWFGYEPAREPTGTWDDIPEKNQRLMIEVCEDLIKVAGLIGIRDDEQQGPGT